MRAQVVEHRVDRVDRVGDPAIHLVQEVDPVGNRASRVRRGRGPGEGAEDVPRAPPPLVRFLRCPIPAGR